MTETTLIHVTRIALAVALVATVATGSTAAAPATTDTQAITDAPAQVTGGTFAAPDGGGTPDQAGSQGSYDDDADDADGEGFGEDDVPSPNPG